MDSKNFDTCASFHINNGTFFGRFIRLDKVVNDIISKHDYPATVNAIIAESTALAALLASTIKYDGLFTLQTKSDGPVSMIVVDVTSDGKIRACAEFDEDRINAAKALRKTLNEHEETPHFLGHGYLAFTVDQGGPDKMYQGVVDIQGKTLSECAMRYFAQSEQIDTAIKLFVHEPQTPEGAWASAGILLQKLPLKGGKNVSEEDVAESWHEATVFLESLQADEVFNADLSNEELLHRLYHANNLEVQQSKTYTFSCRCNREKLQAILGAMKPEELDSLTENGRISAQCHFCGTKYSFEKGELLKQ